MSEILPPDQDDYLLQQLGSASQADAPLDAAGLKVKEKFAWSDQQYGAAIQRLKDRGWITAHIQKDGSDKYNSVIIREVTATGWDRIKQLRSDEDPG